MGILRERPQDLDRCLSVRYHVQACVIVTPEPASESLLEILPRPVGMQAIELLLIHLVVPFHLVIQARGSRGNEAMRGPEVPTHGRRGVNLHRASRGVLGPAGYRYTSG